MAAGLPESDCHRKGVTMNALRSFVVSIAVCSLFASSLARADDCSDALMAESCACKSSVRSEHSSHKASARRSKPSKGAETKVAQRTKKSVASADEINPSK
jgi:hypothetical protein